MMKYLVFRYADTTIEKLYLFPDTVEHKQFVEQMPEGWKALRGGFAWLTCGKLQCFGEAFSLGLFSDKKKDLELLKSEFVND